MAQRTEPLTKDRCLTVSTKSTQRKPEIRTSNPRAGKKKKEYWFAAHSIEDSGIFTLPLWGRVYWKLSEMGKDLNTKLFNLTLTCLGAVDVWGRLESVKVPLYSDIITIIIWGSKREASHWGCKGWWWWLQGGDLGSPLQYVALSVLIAGVGWGRGMGDRWRRIYSLSSLFPWVTCWSPGTLNFLNL